MLQKPWSHKVLWRKNLEICSIQIESVTNQQIILCVYRSPSGNFHRFLNLSEIMLMSLYRPKIEFVICGVVNIDYLSGSYRKQQLSQVLGSYNMLHMVNFPTRFQNNHSSAIDNIFVNNSWLHLCSILPLYNGLSYQNAQCLILKKFFVKKENNVPQIHDKTSQQIQLVPFKSCYWRKLGKWCIRSMILMKFSVTFCEYISIFLKLVFM